MGHEHVTTGRTTSPSPAAVPARAPAARQPAAAEMLSLQRTAGNKAARQTLSRCGCAGSCGHGPDFLDEESLRRGGRG